MHAKGVGSREVPEVSTDTELVFNNLSWLYHVNSEENVHLLEFVIDCFQLY